MRRFYKPLAVSRVMERAKKTIQREKLYVNNYIVLHLILHTTYRVYSPRM